jgi:hypothetical protein
MNENLYKISSKLCTEVFDNIEIIAPNHDNLHIVG